MKKVFLEISQNSQESPVPESLFFCNFIKKETLAKVFSCGFCQISKNTFSYRTPLVAASVLLFYFLLAVFNYFFFFKLSEHSKRITYKSIPIPPVDKKLWRKNFNPENGCFITVQGVNILYGKNKVIILSLP